MTKLRIAKWQGPVSPTGRSPEPARIAPPDPIPSYFAGTMRQLARQMANSDFAEIERRLLAQLEEGHDCDRNGCIHDEHIIREPIAEECDADRMGAV